MHVVPQQLWDVYGTLRQEQLSPAVYIEQLTYLLYVNRADSRGDLPDGLTWSDLRRASRGRLTERYSTLLALLKHSGAHSAVLNTDAALRLSNPGNLKKMMTAIDESDWHSTGDEQRAADYDALLELAAEEGTRGIGYFFTPRPLIAMVCRLMKPDPGERSGFTIHDPIARTGGFLVGARKWLLGAQNAEPGPAEGIYSGCEAQERLVSLASMNMLLNGLHPAIESRDVVQEPTAEQYDCILTHLPLNPRGNATAPDRPDLYIATPNRQLNLVQHIVGALKPGGRAAIVLSDTCLLDPQAGKVFRRLMDDCTMHTLLRLPRGVFMPYAQGVKSNILFLHKNGPTDQLWVYDARSNVERITRRTRPLSAAHFADFEACYGDDPYGGSERTDTGPEGRFRCFRRDDLERLDYRPDIIWLEDTMMDEAVSLPEPQDLALEAVVQLEAVVDDLRGLIAMMENKQFPRQE